MGGAQRGDLGQRVAELDENLIGVLTEQRRAMTDAAADVSKFQDDPAFQPLLGELEATGRTLLSVSLATEITP